MKKGQVLFCVTAVIIAGMFMFWHSSGKKAHSPTNPKFLDSGYAWFSTADGSHKVEQHFYYKLDIGEDKPMYSMEYQDRIGDSVIKQTRDSHAVIKPLNGPPKDTVYKIPKDSTLPRFKRTFIAVDESQFVTFEKK